MPILLDKPVRWAFDLTLHIKKCITCSYDGKISKETIKDEIAWLKANGHI